MQQFYFLFNGVLGCLVFHPQKFKSLERISYYIIAVVVLTSISFGYGQILYFGLDDLLFPFSGMAGGLIAILFNDFLGNIGTFLIISSRGQFLSEAI